MRGVLAGQAGIDEFRQLAAGGTLEFLENAERPGDGVTAQAQIDDLLESPGS